MELYDYDTGDMIGDATPEQVEASEGAINDTGVFAIDQDGEPLREDETTPDDRRVYVD